MQKEKLLHAIYKQLDLKIERLRLTTHSLKESRDNETKSTAGDKYETGREMVQQELVKTKTQLARTEKLKIELSKINVIKQSEEISFGSIVITDSGNYFVSLALGKIQIKDTGYFCISMASPIGKAFYQKKKGDTIVFQNKIIQILDIV